MFVQPITKTKTKIDLIGSLWSLSTQSVLNNEICYFCYISIVFLKNTFVWFLVVPKTCLLEYDYTVYTVQYSIGIMMHDSWNKMKCGSFWPKKQFTWSTIGLLGCAPLEVKPWQKVHFIFNLRTGRF
jgi:hypothetical protein